jgi:hypothetical protein
MIESFLSSTTASSQNAGTPTRIRTASHTYMFERTSDEKKALNSIEGSFGPTFGNDEPHRFRVVEEEPDFKNIGVFFKLIIQSVFRHNYWFWFFFSCVALK